MLPSQVRLSTKVTNKLQYMKSQTGVTPNILSRIAIMLAIKEGNKLTDAGVGDYDGQVLNKSVLFGDEIDTYDIILNQYLHENDITLDPSKAITALIEVGVHKMGHVKNLIELCELN